MKIISQAALYLDTTGMTPYQVIERVGRTCYKSEDKITDESAKKFVAGLVKSGHHAMIEFGYIYMKITDIDFLEFFDAIKPDFIHKEGEYVVGNFRAFYDLYKAWLDGEWMISMDYFDGFMDLIWALSVKYPEVFKDLYDKIHEKFEPDYDDTAVMNDPDAITKPFKLFNTQEDFIDDYVTQDNFQRYLVNLIPHIVMFTTGRAISHELVRHRPCSFAQESTRYCNYTKGKFGGEISVIEPLFEPDSDKYKIYMDSCMRAEADYFNLINLGATAQEARDILPTDLKTDIWVGAFENEWQHIINLRYHGTTGAPHPKMKNLMAIAYPQLVEASNGRIK